MQQRNQKLIHAIIEKANRDYPGALAIIGIYGSFLTGDVHEKSDLDLMILINDDRGYNLARTFILEDEEIGHDLYCTTWDALESDAKFTHPHISKLMESRIVYCADDGFRMRLEALRQKAMTADTRHAAEETFVNAQRFYANAMLAEEISDIRFHAGAVIHYVKDAVALLNHRYFKLGTRRVFEEIEAMECRPKNLRGLVDAVVCAANAEDLKTALTCLLKSVKPLFEAPKPSAEIFPGTYEEMFSNWRNKMYLAAQTGNTYLAFDSMGGLNQMLADLGFSMDVLSRFDPNDLAASAKAYDAILAEYRKEYDKAGIAVESYPDVDAFIKEYSKKETA